MVQMLQNMPSMSISSGVCVVVMDEILVNTGKLLPVNVSQHLLPSLTVMTPFL